MAKFKRDEFVKVIQPENNLNEIAQVMEIDIHCNPVWYTIKIEHGQAAVFMDVPEICLNKIEPSSVDNKVSMKDIVDTLYGMLNTFKLKNEKYVSSFEKSLDKYGIIAAVTRMSDKWNRFENLILNNDSGTNDESLQDTLIDLANYCVMTAVYLKNKETANGSK